MKTSLSHLPPNKQQEISRIVEIIREVVQPEKIILFGSYAKGTFVEHRYHTKDGIDNEYISDYDFLVVTKESPEKPYLQESTILDRVDRYKPPVNLEIHSMAYINDGLSWGQYFFTEIVSEGIVLYATEDSADFIAPRMLTAEEEKSKAQDYYNIWFARNEDFLTVAGFCLVENRLKVGAFNLHQAAESLYYALLLVFTGYKPRVHNLWKLRKKTKQYSEALFLIFKVESDKQEEHLFDLLKRGYIDARYKEDYVITREELASLIDRVKTMVSLVEKICRNKIDSLG
ncbi:HEPN domain-containing protein [Chryseolinea soli]|nr:HEPN domain-containing protein [Chryseolinea soli]